MAKAAAWALALAFSYLEPGQSQYWAVTNGLAWPGLNGPGLAWLMALSQAGHITMLACTWGLPLSIPLALPCHFIFFITAIRQLSFLMFSRFSNLKWVSRDILHL